MKRRTDKNLAGVRVLLLEGFTRQNMAMIRAMHDLGCHVTTYNQSRLDIGYASRFPDRKLLGFWDRNDMDASLAALTEELKTGKYDVVIPMTDFSATMLSRHKTALSAYARLAVNDWDAFRNAIDKQNTMRICQERGLPCPQTLPEVQSVDDVLASGLPYPFIIKPRTGYGSIGFHRIDNEAQLRAAFDTTKEQCGPLLVQEYIPQTGKQYKAEVMIDGGGAVKSCCVFDKTRWYPVDGGSTCCSTTVRRPDIEQTACALLLAMGWRGYGDVDLIEDPRDGAVKVMEVNPRITACVKICFFAGVDFARQIVEHETGRPVTAYPAYAEGRCLRYMHTDVLWFLQSPDRFRTKPSWFRVKNTTDQIFSLADPWPWFTYSLQAVKKYKTEMQKRKR